MPTTLFSYNQLSSLNSYGPFASVKYGDITSIALPNGGFAIGYTDKNFSVSRAYVNIYDNSGLYISNYGLSSISGYNTDNISFALDNNNNLVVNYLNWKLTALQNDYVVDYRVDTSIFSPMNSLISYNHSVAIPFNYFVDNNSISLLQDGRLAVGYLQKYGIFDPNDAYIAIISPNGDYPNPNPKIILEEGVINDSENLSITTINNGNIVAVWENNSYIFGQSVWGAVYSSTGAVIKAPYVIDGVGYYNGRVDVIRLSGGGFAIGYTDSQYASNGNSSTYTSSDIVFRRFQPDGTQLSPTSTRIVSNQSDIFSGSPGYKQFLGMTQLNDGNIVFAWAEKNINTDKYDIYFRSLTESGVMIGDVIYTGLSSRSTIYSGDDNFEEFSIIALSDQGEGIKNRFLISYIDRSANGSDALKYSYIFQTERRTTGDATDEALVAPNDAVRDNMFGNGGNDAIQGLGGNDELNGGDGNDTIEGGTGQDVVRGGAGDDRIIVGDADVALYEQYYGDAGFDTFFHIGASLLDLRTSTISSIEQFRFDTGGQSASKEIRLSGYSATTLSLQPSVAIAFSDVNASTVTIDLNNRPGIPDNISSISLANWTFTNAGPDDKVRIIGDGDAELITGSVVSDSITGDAGQDTINGLAGNDTIYGGADDDSIDGGNDNDILLGDAGNDTLIGGAGVNTFVGGAGADRMDGSAGTSDTVSYGNATEGLFLRLSLGYIPLGTTSGDAVGDLYIGIENVRFSDYGDVFIGGASSPFAFSNIYMGAGSDLAVTGPSPGGQPTYYWGEAGDDTFAYGNINGSWTVIDGGTGMDTVSFVFRTGTGLDINMSATINASGAFNVSAWGQLQTIVNVENIIGTNFDDLIIGNAGANRLEGLDGQDNMAGGAGNDTMLGGAGDDQLAGEGGNNTIDGGTGFDRISYWTTTGVNFVLPESGSGSFQTLQGTDVFTSIEGVDGSQFNADVLTGNSTENRLFGFGGNDTLTGGGGNDTLSGGTGDDRFVYGANSGADTILDFLAGGTEDRIDLSAFPALTNFAAVLALAAPSGFSDTIITLSPGNTIFLQGVTVGSLTAADFVYATSTVNVINGTSGADTLVGVAGQDSISGLAGEDVLFGTGSNDTLLGGNDNDLLRGGDGNDSIDGGNGTDILSYADSSGVTLTLGVGGTGSFTLTGVNALLGTDTYTGVEGLEGSATGNDSLTANASGSYLYGLGGNDTLTGGTGVDTLDGGAGNDLLDGGGAGDTLMGGAGNDTILASADFDLILAGDNDDLVRTGTSFESSAIYGGDGIDTLDLRYAAALSEPFYIIYDTIFRGEDTSYIYIPEFENYILDDNDWRVYGGDAANSIIAGSGNNELYGEYGDDSIIGGSGIDNVTGGVGKDTLRGGGGSDAIQGNEGDDSLDGGEGNDLVLGGAGNDIILGGNGDNDLQAGEGNDSVTGGNNFDNVTGGEGNDTLRGGEGDDFLRGDAGDDSIDGGGGLDLISYYSSDGVNLTLAEGGAGSFTIAGWGTDTYTSIEGIDGSVESGDTLTGNSANNLLRGFNGADSLSGAVGDDTLEGGDGADTLAGGDGSDVSLAGEGDDTFLVASSQVATDVFDGGNGIDQIICTETGGIVDFRLATITDVETLVIGNQLSAYLLGSQLGSGKINTITGLADSAQALLTFGNADLSAVSFADWDDTQDLVQFVDGTNVKGSQRADLINATASADSLEGFGGNDAIIAGGGNDTLDGGSGNDFLNGGTGDDGLNGGADFDYANYLDATSGVTVSLAITTAQVTGGAGTETLTSIEGIFGSNFGDSLTGDGADVNAIFGWGGADSISGAGGFDYVEAGEGDDTMDGGAGDDYLLGGNGIDTLTFAGATAAVYVDMSGPSAFANGTATGFDVLLSVERIIGSGFGDFLFGSAGTDTLTGGVGIDIIYGFGLGDSLDGGADTDYIVGGTGADTITSGAGQDYIYFQGQNEGKDTITDWRANGFDILCIDEPAFGGGLAVNLYLDQGANIGRFVTGTVATAAIGQFLWNSATSTLSWDADGTGGGAAVQLVTLTGVTSLAAGDILVL